MPTKNNPGPFDCYTKAEPDEPMFVLLARDKHGPTLVWLWSVLRELDGEMPDIVDEAIECCAAMIHWSAERNRPVVGLGQAVLAGTLSLIRQANQAIKTAENQPTELSAMVLRLLAETVIQEPKEKE